MWLWRLSGFAWLFFPVCLLIQALAGESSWIVFASMAVTQLALCIPVLSVTIAAAALRRWKVVKVSAPICLLSLLWAGGFCWGFPSHTNGPRIRVMTFNVEKFTNHSIDEVASLIRRVDPDVVCLQEGARLPPPWQVPPELEKALPGYRLVSSGEIGILSRFPIRSFESVNLGAGPESRPLLVAHLDVEGQEVAVASVHFQFFPWDHPTRQEIENAAGVREIQGRTLEAFAQSHRRSLILCGDFNSVPNAPVIRKLDLTDAFAATHFGFGWTVPSSFPLRRLDYVFVGVNLRPLSTEVVDEVKSDHRPLVAEIGLSPK